ncbi:glutamate receptor ionotropic, NMDA 2B-like [Paramacrobiotus metropolitanus]|uniref:glutamate receptor ionotropic, NMDA 2B-like n=1 Tax=Paramacrobiotus metropolitanus TaxID=2943436 RepID=UPI002445DF4D|nr:glutamate receptor ionotropic, NMDA 2B-like [Paramacrobiotus metropolitanus]
MGIVGFLRDPVSRLWFAALCVVCLPALAHGTAAEVRFGILVTNAKQQMLLQRNSHRAVVDYFSNNRFGFTKTVKILPPPVISLDGFLGPSNILSIICNKILAQNVNALVSVSFYEDAKVDEVNALQYLFQLSSYLQIPVISWQTERAERSSDDLLVIQMASTIHHQVKAAFSILERYKWTQFSIVMVKALAGHDAFINAIRQERNKETFKTQILSIIEITSLQPDDIRKHMQTLDSETRVIMFFAHKNAAVAILQIASELGLTGPDHMWICMQKVIGDMTTKTIPPPPEYPVGMLGIDMDMTEANMIKIVGNGIKIYGHAMDILVQESNVSASSFSPNISCDTDDAVWALGRDFYKAMRKVKVPLLTSRNSPEIQFTKDGGTTYAEFDVVNLVIDKKQRTRAWKQVGSWNTLLGLQLSDIMWPAHLPVPPRGRPEKFHLTVVTLEEVPYVWIKPTGPGGKCEVRTAPCRVRPKAVLDVVNITESWQDWCCTGLSIDLLTKLGADIGFTFDIYQVEDLKWGRKTINGSWNGLVADLLKRKAHLAMTSLTVTKERQAAISFSTAYLGTGIGIVVAKQEGRISPTAFLEPFDYVTWIVLVVACIQTVSIFIFAFEWLSPSGFNMQSIPDEDNRFSFFRVYWLVFTIFFGAPCPVILPRSFTAKFLTAVWACCAFVFIAVYTANLATFMITRDDLLLIQGIQDRRFHNESKSNPFRFGTISSGSTVETIRQTYEHMYHYMQKYNKDNISQGIEAVKNGQLDAFLYDASVLEYRVGSDTACKIQTVGSWFATTGYAIGFPQGSPLIAVFDEHLLKYQQNGYLEQLQQFWLTGACNLKSQKEDKSSHALGPKNFTSAFIFLGAGIVSGILCLIVEWIYFKFINFGICSAVFESSTCQFLSVNIFKAVRAEKIRHPRQLVPDTDIPVNTERRRSSAVEDDLARISAELVIARMQVHKLENIQKRLRKSPLRKVDSIVGQPRSGAPAGPETPLRKRTGKRPGMQDADINGTSLHVVEMETVL